MTSLAPETASDPSQLSAQEALAAMRAGALTAQELMRACLARIEARDTRVRAFVDLDEGALDAAAAAGGRN